MKHTWWRAGGSCLVAVSFLAAACGGDSEQLTELKDQVAALEEKLEQTTTTVAPTTSPTATTTSTTSAPATTTTTTTQVPATTATATASTTTQVPTTTHTSTTTQAPTTTEAPLLAAIRQRYPAWQNGCSGMGSVMFANSPMRPEDFESLLPYGKIVGAHVTPIDHMYFSPADWSLGRDAYEVRAIQDGLIYNLEPRDINVDANAAKEREWRMDIAHSCTFASYFDLITSLSPELEAIWSKWGAVPPDGIPIQAGQLVGWIGGQTLDFGVYDWEVVLPGFINPSRYDGEPWKIHTVDPFPYFPVDVREALLAKMERQVEPRAGKIDHDIDGRLVGNWFQQGTGGYQDPGDTWNYWDGHLAFVPDAIDPSVWWFSIGNYDGEANQFPLRGDQPDPRDVSVNSGPVTYVLTHPYNPGEEVGVVLVEMTADRTVNLEVFAGQTVPEVAGFTDAMRIYER